MSFSGTTYDDKLDGPRLTQQYQRAFACMADGQWRTLEALADMVGAPTHSVSARLRDMRKKRFGAHLVERKRIAGGLYEYRLIVNTWSDLI
jgi:DNA-binding Lrp family transcriptional regulator